MRDLGPDDIDRLFARLEQVEPPHDFALRLMARIDARDEGFNRQPVWRRGFAYASAYVLALIVLTVLAYSIGVSLAHNGTSTLIATLVNHAEVFAYAPGAYLQAILSSIPWLQLAGLLADLLVLALVTRLLLNGAHSFQRPTA